MGHLRRMYPRRTGESLTVLSPLSASSATRALHSALYCFRCVDISTLLTSVIFLTQQFYLNDLSSFRGTLYTTPKKGRPSLDM